MSGPIRLNVAGSVDVGGSAAAVEVLVEVRANIRHLKHKRETFSVKIKIYCRKILRVLETFLSNLKRAIRAFSGLCK
jgi:hypothetical protein